MLVSLDHVRLRTNVNNHMDSENSMELMIESICLLMLNSSSLMVDSLSLYKPDACMFLFRGPMCVATRLNLE